MCAVPVPSVELRLPALHLEDRVGEGFHVELLAGCLCPVFAQLL